VIRHMAFIRRYIIFNHTVSFQSEVYAISVVICRTAKYMINHDKVNLVTYLILDGQCNHKICFLFQKLIMITDVFNYPEEMFNPITYRKT
jgi:hypothetical protein